MATRGHGGERNTWPRGSDRPPQASASSLAGRNTSRPGETVCHRADTDSRKLSGHETPGAHPARHMSRKNRLAAPAPRRRHVFHPAVSLVTPTPRPLGPSPAAPRKPALARLGCRSEARAHVTAAWRGNACRSGRCHSPCNSRLVRVGPPRHGRPAMEDGERAGAGRPGVAPGRAGPLGRGMADSIGRAAVPDRGPLGTRRGRRRNPRRRRTALIE